jgi:hypothetical protein
VQSLKLSTGCKKVLLIDDDSSYQCNPYIYNSHPDLNYFHTYSAGGCADSSSDDLEDDIKGYYLYPTYKNSVQSQLEKQQALVNNNKLQAKVNPELAKGLNDPKLAPKTKAPVKDNCWMCEPFEMLGPAGYTKQTCWKGAEKDGEKKCGSDLFEEIAKNRKGSAEQCLMSHHSSWSGYTCPRARYYCSDDKDICTMSDGDGTGGTEKSVAPGSASEKACIQEVKKLQPTANGATRSPTTGACYAEFGMTGQTTGKGWRTCKWGGWKKHVQECCGCMKKTVVDINCRCNKWMEQDTKTEQEDEAYKKQVAGLKTPLKGRADFEAKDFQGPVNSRL